MNTLEQLDFKNKKVFVRADLNVPFNEQGEIADDTRIKAALNTVSYILGRGASVTLASHLGRPKGEVNKKYSLAPVAKRIEELLDREVKFADDCISDEAASSRANQQAGDLLLLENLRFYAQEEKNEDSFAQQLAKNADIFVNDAFGTAHRAHASTAGIAAHVAEKAAGLTLQKELEYFNSAFANPKRPCAIIFGGAKISTKLAAIQNAAKQADYIFIGGAMANTFFAADDKEVGKSLIEPDLLDTARKIKAELQDKLVLPTDVVVAKEFSGGIDHNVVGIDEIPADEMALDIGPESIKSYVAKLAEMQTIVWNGPMGAFEIDEYSKGTYAIVDALSESSALTVVGGGDTDLALHNRHAIDKMSYVSTGGGAFLTLLEGAELPAVSALL